MNRDRNRMMAGQHDAADQQPWRCDKCGEAVSHIRRNDCKCIREARQQESAPKTEGGSAQEQ